MLTLALALCLPQHPIPLDVGHRWTYERDGDTAAIVEVVEERQLADETARVVRVRGASLFWIIGDLLVQADDSGACQQLATVYSGHTTEETALLVPAKLIVGDRWQTGSFRAEVKAKERVRVKAGSYDAFQVEYVLGNHLGTECDLRVWITPGVGIVKFSHWRTSMRGQKSPMAAEVYSLAEVIDLRSHRFAPPPLMTVKEREQLKQCIVQLKDSDPPQTEQCLLQIERIGRAALPRLLAAARQPNIDKRLQHRLETMLARFPKLRLTARAKAEIVAGELPQLSFRLHNDWPEPLQVLPSLDGSDGGRMPHYAIEMFGPDGTRQAVQVLGCGNMNPLVPEDFRTLQPGESLDPYGPGQFLPPLLTYRPKTPGLYRVRLVLDTTGKIPNAWQTEIDGPMHPDARPLLDRLPQVRVASNEVTFLVR